MSAQFETFGKYVLLEKLATGGMAEVFLARGTGAGGIGKFFAIKRILPQYADSPEFIEMFKDEAKIAINLSHSNIVSIHEFGVEKGQFFLVMDYVEGRNLRQILNKMKKTGIQFSMDQIVYMVKEVAAGLDHAHRCIDGTTGRPLNITHRDMSPQNVMVTFDGEVRIVDFGIAKAESQIETTRAGTLKGKFGYMSPEQAEGQPVDLRTDIFSLGIVLWELLASDRLFVANNEVNTLRKIRDCQIPSLRKINPNIHAELERCVQKALARDRNLRYQTGAAVHRDLNRFLNRQYPDFSPQDFAVFIKSVFADEILSLRKRLVEYAKVNLAIDLTIPPIRSKEGTGTATASMFTTDTDSLVVATDTKNPKKMTVPTAKPAHPDDKTVNSDVSLTHDTKALDEKSVTASDPTLVTPVDHTAPIQTAPLQMAPVHPPLPTTADSPASGLLDVKALEAESQQKRERIIRPRVQPLESRMNSSPTLETEDISSPSYRMRRNPRQKPAEFRVYKKNQGTIRTATMTVFVSLCFGIYAYLCHFYPLTMEPAIVSTYDYAPWFYSGIGVESPSREVTSSSSATPPANPIPLPNLEVEVPNSLSVTSSPSGAEIWLNGESTGKTTPHPINVPSHEPFTITLRKRGYLDYKRADVTREALGQKMDATLEKMYVGYLEVEIFPPQEAVLIINGQQIAMNRTMNRELRVPADRPIKVRAESRNGETYDEQTVSVPVDRRKLIKLNPRKNAVRIPSGTPNH